MRAYSAYSDETVKCFDKWLYAICVNLFKDTYRKKVRMPAEVQFETNEHKDAFMSSIEDKREYDEVDYTLLYRAIDKLPEKLRCVISLRYFSDMSCSEISEVLNISVSAVTTRLSRAIKKLSAEMNSGKE